MIESPLKQPGYECLIPSTLTATLLEGLHPAEVTPDGERTVQATQLPLLQLTLQQMWQLQNRRGAYAMSHEDYAAVGPVSDVLNRWADDILRGLNKFDEDVAERILAEELVRRDASGRQPPRPRWRYVAELPANTGERAAVERVVAALEAEGLLVSEGTGDSKRVRLVHEVLLTQWDRLRMWLENAEYALWLKRVRRTSVAEPLWRRLFGAVRVPLVRGFRRAFGERPLPTSKAPVAEARRVGWRLFVVGVGLALVFVAGVLVMRGVRPPWGSTEAFDSTLTAGAERLVNRDPAGLVDLANAYLDASGNKEQQRALAAVWSAWVSQWEGKLLATIPSPPAEVVLSPNGVHLTTASGGLWNVETGEQLEPADGAAFVSEDRTEVAFASGGRIRIRHFDSGKSLGVALPFEGIPTHLVFSASGEHIAASRGKRLVVWETASGNVVGEVENDAPLGKIGLAGSGDWLVAISGTPQENATVTDLFVWNLKGKPARRSLNKADDFVISPTGRFIAAVKNRRSTVEIFDTATLLTSLDRVAEVRTNRVDSVRFSPDESLLITRSYSSERVWDRATGTRIGDRVRTILFPRGEGPALVLYEKGSLAFRLEGGQTTETPVVSSTGEAFTHARQASDSAWAVVSSEEAVAFVNLSLRRMTTTLRGYRDGDVRDGVGYVTDGVLTRRVDPTTGSQKAEAVSGALVAVGRGGQLVTANDARSVNLWSAEAPSQKERYVKLPEGWTPFALAPDGSTGLAQAPDSSVQAFDARSGELVGEVYRLPAGKLRVVYSPDGRYVAFGANDYVLADLREHRTLESGRCWGGFFALSETAFAVVRDASTVEVRRLDGRGGVRSFVFSKPLSATSLLWFDSQLRVGALSTRHGGDVEVIAWKEGSEKRKPFLLSGTLAGSPAFDPKGTRLAVPYGSGNQVSVDVFHLREDKTETLTFANGVIEDVVVAFDREGKRLVASSPSVGEFGQTTCWSLRGGIKLWQTPVGGTRIAWDRSGIRLAVGGTVLDARTGIPFPPILPVRPATALDAPVVALFRDGSYASLREEGVVTVEVASPAWKPEEMVERTAAVTGFRPRGSSSEPFRLDPQEWSQLRSRIRQDREEGRPLR